MMVMMVIDGDVLANPRRDVDLSWVVAVSAEGLSLDQHSSWLKHHHQSPSSPSFDCRRAIGWNCKKCMASRLAGQLLSK
jgi:hypothetical protein